MKIHRLVLEAFVGPCPEGKECNHKNHERDDNELTNLEWVTRSENNKHRRMTDKWRAAIWRMNEANRVKILKAKDAINSDKAIDERSLL